MLRSDFRRVAHTNFQKHVLYRMCFFQNIDVKSTSFSRKVRIESNFHLSVSIDVFNYYNAKNIKNKIFRCVNSPTTYKLFDASESTVPHFVTSL